MGLLLLLCFFNHNRGGQEKPRQAAALTGMEGVAVVQVVIVVVGLSVVLVASPISWGVGSFL
jgi:hypothetical protein